MNTLNRTLLYGLLIGAILLLGLASLSAGKIWVPWSAWLHASNDPRWVIIFELRLPRTLLAIAVGAALGICGAALQGYTRNPLAEPSVLGVASMAAFGAVMTLYLGVAATMPWVLPAGGMVGALIGTIVLLALSGTSSSVLTFILAGVILNAVAAAGVSLALSLAPSPWAVNEIVNWLMGSLADRSMDELRMALPFIIAGCVLLLTMRQTLDALTLGEIGARSVGINLTLARVILAVGMALTVGASVAVTGVVSFVGLITPHLLRPLVGARPGALLLPSALGGAVLVLAGDILVRLTPTAAEIKLGIAMSALGGPFFLALLVVHRRRIA